MPAISSMVESVTLRNNNNLKIQMPIKASRLQVEVAPQAVFRKLVSTQTTPGSLVLSLQVAEHRPWVASPTKKM